MGGGRGTKPPGNCRDTECELAKIIPAHLHTCMYVITVVELILWPCVLLAGSFP